MFWLDIITLFLIILLLIGVCYIVLEFLKQLIDKKDLETEFEELGSQFREYQKNHLDQMDGYQRSYESLSQQFCQYQKKVGKGLENINNDIDEIFRQLDAMLSSIPYEHWKADHESIFHIIAHLTFKIVGLNVHSEVHSSKGRSDVVVYTDQYIYVLELKLNSSPQEAMEQLLDPSDNRNSISR